MFPIRILRAGCNKALLNGLQTKTHQDYITKIISLFSEYIDVIIYKVFIQSIATKLESDALSGMKGLSWI